MSATGFRSLVAGLAIALAAPASADPIVTVTQGSGPGERVLEYRLAPDALDFRSGTVEMQTLIGAIETGAASARAEAEYTAGLQLFGDAYGGVQVIGTLGEKALQLGALSGVTELMGYGGMIFAVVQVANDLDQGNDTAAAGTAYKAMLEFAVSTYGWSAVQVAGASLYFFDITLREWEAGVRQSYLDRWRPGLQRYFREDPVVRRDKNDWTRRVWSLYLQAEREAGDLRDADVNRFRDLMDAELTTYVGHVNIENISFYTELERTGGGGGGLNDQIIGALRAEQKLALEAMLARDVLPQIGLRARERQLINLVARMNRDQVSRMNRPIMLAVTAWGVPAGSQVRIAALGGDWGGPLAADGTFTLEFTRHAWLKAGLPDRIFLASPEGEVSAPLTVLGDQAVAIFGAPQAAAITRSVLTEGERSCRLSRFTLTRQFIDSEGYRFPAHSPVTMDTANLADNRIIAGIYDAGANRWRQASPGVYLYGTQLHFGPPLLDGLSILDSCNTSLFTPAGQVATGQCRFIRQSERLRGNEILQMRCESDGQIAVSGVFADMGDGFQYFPLDGATGQILTEIMRKSITEGVEGMSPDMLQGLTGLPPGIKPGTIPGLSPNTGGN